MRIKLLMADPCESLLLPITFFGLPKSETLATSVEFSVNTIRHYGAQVNFRVLGGFWRESWRENSKTQKFPSFSLNPKTQDVLFCIISSKKTSQNTSSIKYSESVERGFIGSFVSFGEKTCKGHFSHFFHFF